MSLGNPIYLQISTLPYNPLIKKEIIKTLKLFEPNEKRI
jgi:hypothetical protein